MLYSQGRIKRILDELLTGESVPETLPDWARPVADTCASRNRECLRIGQSTVSSMRTVTGVVKDSLSFGRSLNGVKEQSQMLAAATEQMASTANEISGLGEVARERAESVDALAESGQEALANLIARMENIEKVIKDVGREVAAFVEQTRQINHLTASVNEIADQTNLLALNAAIEAARAGDHGRGFAVVAGEVRGLATRSAEAATEIDTIVSSLVAGADTIFSDVNSAVEALDDSVRHREQVSEVMNQTRSSSRESLDMTLRIATAASQQASVSGEMAASIQSVSSEIDDIGSNFTGISGALESIRQQTHETLGILGERPDHRMILTLAKSDHIVWVDKLFRFAVFGEHSLTEQELKDHHQCRLGKYLDGPGASQLRAANGFDYLYSKLHPRVHEAGIRLYRSAASTARGQVTDQVRREADELLALSDEVVSILDSMLEQI